MTTEKVKTVVIGSGVAGMTAATMLAKDFGEEVVVLERNPFIGGRTLSYVGKGNKVVADGVEMDAREFRKSLPLAHCYLGKCTPDIETIFEQGLLDGRTFEAGGHGLFWGNESRAQLMLKHFGKFHNLPLNEGLGFVDWQGEGEDGEGKAGVTYQVGKGQPYQWMSPEGFAKTMEQLRDMGKATFADMAKLMRSSLQEWFEERSMDPEAYDYIKVLAASQTAQAEPAMTPAGDFLGYMAIARDIKMNLVTGSVATADEPGCIGIPLAMEEALNEHGGEVRRNSPVQDVIIEDGKVTGVTYKADGEVHTIECENVICTIPPKYMFQVLPEDPFPTEWVSMLQEKFWGAGLLTGYCGTKNSLIESMGLDPRSFIYMPGVIRDEGYIGCVDMVMCEFTAWDDGAAKRAPEGKKEYLFSTALTDEEMRDPDKVNRVIELCENWAKATFPTWEDDVEFIIWTPSPEAYGLWRPIGEARPDVKSPHVDGLYFAGDQYGERMWGGGVDGATLSGVMCIDKMMGTGYEEIIFPDFHRGLPEDAVREAAVREAAE